MLQSLERQSGLPLAFDPLAGVLTWPAGRIQGNEASERNADEMRDYRAEAEAQPSSEVVYRVWRHIAHIGDEEKLRAARLRYDITIIRAGAFIGERREYFRTAGHYHSEKPGTGLTYPEVYEVLFGRVYWLIQRPERGNPAALEEIYVIEAGPGEKAVIPPGFGHLTVNAFAEPCVVANVSFDGLTNEYELFRQHRGGGYWIVEGPTKDTIAFEPNPGYLRIPGLSKLRPREVPELGLLRAKPLYTLLRDLEKLRFLIQPEEFTPLLALKRCYKLL